MTAEDILEKLFQHYNVASYVELADKMKTTRQTITNWKTRNSINSIKRKCRELGIYNEIFSTTKNKEDDRNQEYVEFLGDEKFDYELKEKNEEAIRHIDRVTLNIFTQMYVQAIKANSLNDFQIYLLRYLSDNQDKT